MKYLIAIYLFAVATTGFAASKYKEGMVETSEYLDHMSAHHKQGIALAKLGAERAVLPEVKTAAERILQDDQQELTQMQTWRAEKFGIIPPHPVSQHSKKFPNLTASKAGEFDKVFLENMIAHQQEGIELSRMAIPSLEDKAIIEFTKENTSESEKEVTELQLIQGSLNSRRF